MAQLVGKDGGVVTISSECGMLVCNGQILCFPCPFRLFSSEISLIGLVGAESCGSDSL